MSSVNTYAIATPITLPAAAAAAVVGGVAVLGGAAVAVTQAVWTGANLAAQSIGRWMDDTDVLYGSILTAHRLNIRSGLEVYLAEALCDFGYAPLKQSAATAPITWIDQSGGHYVIQEVWVGPEGAIGFSRLEDGAIQAYCRTDEAKADLYKAMQEYTLRVMAAHFPEKEAQTFDVPTDGGDPLPVGISLGLSGGLKATAKVLNKDGDPACLDAIARVDKILGMPVAHRERIQPLRKERQKQVSTPGPSAPLAQPLRIRIGGSG